MKVYLVAREEADWCEDFAMVVIAKDEKYAERKARLSSDDFKKCKNITIKEIDLTKEQCVLIANVGA